MYIEKESEEITIEKLAKFLKPYKPRDIRLKEGYAFAELESPESVKII